MKNIALGFFVYLFFQHQIAFAGAAFGHPGITPHWSSAKKVQAATFYEPLGSTRSPLWFTMAHGVLTEVFFPSVDTAQIKDSQLLMTGPKGKFFEERTQLKHRVRRLSPAMVELINTTPNNEVTISHTFYSLGTAPILVDKVKIDVTQDGWKFFQLVSPHLANTGFHDSAYLTKLGFAVQDGRTFMEVESTCGFEKRSVGFVGYSDGYQDLHKDGMMDFEFDRAENGHVALTGKLAIPETAGSYECYIIYSFQTSKGQGKPTASFNKRELEQGHELFDSSWRNYLEQLKSPNFLNSQEKYLYERSLVTLKSHEDKNSPGALVASLSIPWGEQQYESNGANIGGYHLIWPRDLFHVSLALLLSGDESTPVQALEYLSRIQYGPKSGMWEYGNRKLQKNGAWPQNTWVNGKEYWSGFQIDQVGYPIQLFYHVYQQSAQVSRTQLREKLSPMVARGMDFIMQHGPWSAQERWEENFGISPSSFSAATAALLMGHKLSPDSQRGQNAYRIARQWLDKPGDNIDTWTFTNKGILGDGQYYLRVAGCSTYEAVWNPNDSTSCHLANSSDRLNPSAFIDQGFLQLSLLGLRPANDWRLLKSLDVVNQQIRAQTAKGAGWFRYKHDAYGDGGKGRIWPLLAGEHGRFALERMRAGNLTEEAAMVQVQQIIDSFIAMANDGGMLPEQVFEDSGEGTGAATPLAWSHAEFIKLLWSRHYKRNVENIQFNQIK